MNDLIAHTKVIEYLAEKDGRRYVTYVFTTIHGDTIVYPNILEKPDTDILMKTLELEDRAIGKLARKEKELAYSMAIKEGINPIDLVYKYNEKGAIINDLYSSKVLPLEKEAADSLTAVQNLGNRIRLFLGLV